VGDRPPQGYQGDGSPTAKPERAGTDPQKAQDKVLGPDVPVPQDPGLLLRQCNELMGGFSKPLEHAVPPRTRAVSQSAIFSADSSTWVKPGRDLVTNVVRPLDTLEGTDQSPGE
jgi:hypothetical protein